MTIEKEAFGKWLNAQPPDRKFSYSDVEHCPVSSFIMETTTVPHVTSGGSYTRLWTAPGHKGGTAYEEVRWPEWLYHFMDKAVELGEITAAQMQEHWKENYDN